MENNRIIERRPHHRPSRPGTAETDGVSFVSLNEDRNTKALAGRIGGLIKASRYGANELTQAARDGFLARFDREVDPGGALPPEERRRRAEAARRAHMTRLALRSAQSRRRRLSASLKKATAGTVAEEVRDDGAHLA